MNANELLEQSQMFHKKLLKDNKDKINKLQDNAKKILEKTQKERDKLLKKRAIKKKI
jgi:transcription initiation factor IIF auxiliary subunit